MLLKAENIYKSFAGNQVLTGCDFCAEQGKITALIGPNGAGKTTVFDIITGFIRADRGSIIFDGKDITNNEPFQIARSGLARTFQRVRLFRHLTLLDHLIMAQSGTDENLIWHLRKRTDSATYIHRAKQALEEFKVEKDVHCLVSDLSYGQRKLLTLAMTFLMPHKLLMLDEPVAGVNQKIRDIIVDKLKDLHKAGETVLIIEHDMHFISRIADHVYVLDAGAVIASGTPEEVKKDKHVLEAYLGN
jgi:ABC-type branched-subunit amino acid transport system ATPase component